MVTASVELCVLVFGHMKSFVDDVELHILVALLHACVFCSRTDRAFEAEINCNNPLGTGGRLAISFAVLLRALWKGTHHAFQPSKLKVWQQHPEIFFDDCLYSPVAIFHLEISICLFQFPHFPLFSQFVSNCTGNCGEQSQSVYWLCPAWCPGVHGILAGRTPRGPEPHPEQTLHRDGRLRRAAGRS